MASLSWKTTPYQLRWASGKGKILQISDRKQLIALQKYHKVLRLPIKRIRYKLFNNVGKKIGKIVEMKIGTGSPGMFVQINTIS